MGEMRERRGEETSHHTIYGSNASDYGLVDGVVIVVALDLDQSCFSFFASDQPTIHAMQYVPFYGSKNANPC